MFDLHTIIGQQKWQRASVLAAVLVFLLGAHLAFADQEKPPRRFPVLAACTRYQYDELFKDIKWDDFTVPELAEVSYVSEWMKEYHGTVARVVTEDMSPGALTCTASDYTGMMQPRPELYALAQKLPSWANEEDSDYNNDNMSRLSQLDVGTVLLEYLRMYECALIERSLFLPSDTLTQESGREERAKEIQQNPGSLTEALLNVLKVLLKSVTDYIRIFGLVAADRHTITDELVLARSALHRTLVFIGGYNRLRPIDAEFTCLQQATLDIRNGFALSADAGSCLPRIWNAKDPLRDLQ
ncbi:MAG: hypothetical protein WCX61_00540 [Candidatus Peribacteraceae bacterium]